jgi:DNA-binding GntR family transcriptional regulator
MYDQLPSMDVSSLQERVYQSLRLALLKGNFQPGDTVSIRKLADALGTSAMPVREAVKRLMAEKALIQLPNRQIRITPLDPQLYEETVRIRMKMEGYAAERAARAGNAELVERLTELDNAMVEAVDQDDIEAALAANYAFHFEIYRSAGSPLLVDILESLWVRTGPFLATIRRQPPLAKKFFKSGHRFHVRAITAITNRQPKDAGGAIALDIRTATMLLRKIYDDTGTRMPEGDEASTPVTDR